MQPGTAHTPCSKLGRKQLGLRYPEADADPEEQQEAAHALLEALLGTAHDGWKQGEAAPQLQLEPRRQPRAAPALAAAQPAPQVSTAAQPGRHQPLYAGWQQSRAGRHMAAPATLPSSQTAAEQRAAPPVRTALCQPVAGADHLAAQPVPLAELLSALLQAAAQQQTADAVAPGSAGTAPLPRSASLSVTPMHASAAAHRRAASQQLGAQSLRAEAQVRQALRQG